MDEILSIYWFKKQSAKDESETLKAVLVMDMPKTCKDYSCKYPSYKDYALYDCAITGKTVPIDGGRYGENHIGVLSGNCRRKTQAIQN